jgi:cytochrome c-type biogenesis protein
MTLLIISFVSGVLTVLAPCVLPLLPVIIGSSVSNSNKFKPYIIILGLLLSITIFTILLKASTALLGIDPLFWKVISGGIVTLFGLVYIFPGIWEKITVALKLSSKSDKLLENASNKEGWVGDILIGAALGPVFASCSPTYSLIIATVLPVSFIAGIGYIIVYALGLGSIMLLVALLGRKIVNKLKWASNPNGWFKKILGVLFLIVGISVMTGFDKIIEANIISSENFFDVTQIEQSILDSNLPK